MKRTLDGKVNGTFLRQETAKVPVMELGAVKLLTKASLQHPYTNPILTSEAIMAFRIKRITRIPFFNKTPRDIAKHDGTTREVSIGLNTQGKGTQQFHRLISGDMELSQLPRSA